LTAPTTLQPSEKRKKNLDGTAKEVGAAELRPLAEFHGSNPLFQIQVAPCF